MYAFASLGGACGDNIGASVTPDAAAHRDGAVQRDGAVLTDAPHSSVAPQVTSTSPGANATNVPLNTNITATFNELMDRATLVAGTITLVNMGNSVMITGAVTSTNTTITFEPSSPLSPNTAYVAKITIAAKSAGALALAASVSWTFTTGSTTVAPGVPVVLGTAANFVLLGKSGITNVPTSMITGNIGVSPIDSTAITGLPLTPDSSNQFATTPQVTGRVYAPDFAVPTPTMVGTAVSDMQTAYTAAAGRAPDVTELGAGMIGSITLSPGVYKWSSGLLIPTSVTLSGNSTDVWIFQIAQGLTLSSGTQIVLAGGALAKNVFWQAAGEVIVNTSAHLEGTVLTQTAATLDTGATLNGRLLAQTLVTVRGATIVVPAP